MSTYTLNRTVVIAIAGAMALGAIAPAWAAPVLSNAAALRSAVPSDITDVRYRGGYYHDNGAGVALGVLGVVGAVAAASAYRHHPYGYGYYGNPGYYQQGYAYGPRYYGNGPGYYGDHRGW